MTKKEIREFVNGNAINGKAVVERVIANARNKGFSVSPRVKDDKTYRPGLTMAMAFVDTAVKAA